jgi:uncharacterized protein
MAKLVLLAIAVAAALWLLRGKRRRSADDVGAPARAAESMVRCAQCGVHLPRGDSVDSAGHYFCSRQHEREFVDRA